jgi:hypothetical protein
MKQLTRLPALPLVVNDPYFSIWCAADRLTDTDTTHWAGEKKRLRGRLIIDGKPYRYLGRGEGAAMETVSLTVSPTSTKSVLEASGVRLSIAFTTPLLLNDPDLMSTPITMIDVSLESTDGSGHEAALSFLAYDELCYDGNERPVMMQDAFSAGKLSAAYMGQRRQKLLCHSGDHITIDWGYLYMASRETVSCTADGLEAGFAASLKPGEKKSVSILLGYDDVASINYFGVPTKAWYARNGKTLVEAMAEFDAGHDALISRCEKLDDSLSKEAAEKGGADYELIVTAAYRQCIAAHKLIADENGQMVLLSKENDSNGCLGTVDVSYPSTPLFLKYNPELVRAMCRPIMRFAQMPVWTYDFAPHDVGRYPQATGQVYGAKKRERLCGEVRNGDVHPNYYLYPANADCYEFRYQMPVEECGNMLIMLYSAAAFDGRCELTEAELSLLRKWVQYLLKYGEDPGDQLCTDDFAGHLNRNVNLSAKAMVGVKCYALLLHMLGDKEAGFYEAEAGRMAKSWLKRAQAGDHTSLTFDGQGWSMKYNLAWDKVLKLHLLDEGFYKREIESYLSRINAYGLPLDSRRAYTKSDWILWTAAMTGDPAAFKKLVAPVAGYLRESNTRIPFGDWYDTETGNYIHFIARSVQGGVFMPLI